MVPVGGAFIFSNDKKIIKEISEIYPGRASSAPIIDLFITLLSMGKFGLKKLIEERKENLQYMKEKFKEFSINYNEKILECPDNNISLGMTLQTFICKFFNNIIRTE